MKNHRISYFIIFGLLIFGLGTCGYSATQTGNNGFDGIMPAIIGAIAIVAGVIYAVGFLVSSIFVNRELNSEQDLDFSKDHETTKDIRSKKLIKLIVVSALANCIFVAALYDSSMNHTLRDFGPLLLLFAVWGLVWYGTLKGFELARICWVVLSALLLYHSVMYAIMDGLFNYLLILMILVVIGNLYVINILLRSKVLKRSK